MAAPPAFAKMTLHWKLALVTAATTVLALLMAGALMLAYDTRTSSAEAIQAATAKAEVVAATLYASLVFDDAETAREYLTATAADPGVEVAAVFGASGNLLASYQRPGSAPIPETASVQEPVLAGGHVAVTVPVRDNSQGDIGFVYFRVTMEPLADRLLRFGVIVVLIAAGCLAIVLPFAVNILRRIANPFEELAEKNAIIATTLEAVDHGIVVVESDMKVSYTNARLHDLVPKLTRGTDFVDYMRDAVRDTARDLDTELARLYSTKHMTWELTMGGTQIEVRQAPLPQGGFVRTVTDISEAKALQEQIERARTKAEAADKAKSAFLAAMSHEIRTPMNGVIGLVELLRSTQLADEQRQMVEIIRQSGVSLLDVINDILDYSKIEAGRMTLEKTEFNVTEIIETTAEVVGGHTSSKFLDVACTVDPDLDETLIGDPARLRQVILNIMGNAVKFTSRGLVAIKARALSTSESSMTVMFEVTDTGIGIPEDKQQKLFRPFSQADYSTTRKYGGTGLGLSICKNLIDLMGGEIGVHSSADRGSTFWFRVPFERLPAATRGAPAPRHAQWRAVLAGLRILVCDDLAPDAAATVYLRAAGVEVVEVGDGARAVAALRAQAAQGRPVDMVLVNVRVGDDRAAHAVAEIRAQSDLQDTRIVLIVPHLSAGAARLAASTFACPSIPAPLRRDKLYDTIAHVAGRATEAAEAAVKTPDLGYAAPTVAEAAGKGCLILVAEDNQTNQFVIRSQLQRLGFAAVFVGDGREAWETLSKDWAQYGLVLTDCHMPFVDGYQLTGMIRDRERESAYRLPVVALTANALQGEREICRAAGMDDYLSKPTNLETLEAAMLRWLPAAAALRRPAEHGAARGESVPAAPGPVDLAGLAALVGNDDPAYLREILSMFWEDMRDTPEELLRLSRARDAAALTHAAHAAKGAAASACAQPLSALLLELETSAKREAWEKIDALVPAIALAFRDVDAFIREATGGGADGRA